MVQLRHPLALFAVCVAILFSPGCSWWRGWFGGGEGGPRNVIRLRDIDERKIKIGNGGLYMIVGVTAKGFQPPNVPENYLPPNLLADPELHLVHVVDMAGHLPTALHGSVKRELAKLLKRERHRLELAHQHLGLHRNPEDAVTILFDPDGDTSRLLGLDYGSQSGAVAIYDRSGQRAFFRQGLPPRAELVARLSGIKLGRPAIAAAAPVPDPAPGPAARSTVPAVVVPTTSARPPDAPPRPATDSGYAAARARGEAIAARVSNGRLTRFAVDMVSFVPSRPVPRFGAPGALEDAALASSARANILSLPGLRTRELRVKCEMGTVTVEGAPSDVALIAAVAQGALDVEGVAEARVFFK